MLTLVPLNPIFAESNNNSVTTATGNPVVDNIDNIVYCDYYPWFNNAVWEKGHSNTPLLGFYDSLDSRVLQQHSAWANQFGIDVLKVEYVPSLDGRIQNGILKTDLGNTKVCLMYDVLARYISSKGRPPYNFNDPEIYNMFVNDINHIADTYFSHPNYFNINGRPVLWIYITREFCGNWKHAINQVRQDMNNKGYNVYLVGDHVWWDYDYDGMDLFDAVSTYHVYAGAPQNTKKFADRLKILYSKWKQVAQSKGVDFIPGALPAYDDTCLAYERNCISPLKGSVEDFNYMLKVVSEYLDPVNGAENLKQVTIATFNENHEGSGVEPSQEWDYTRIEQIPKVFGNN